MNSTLEYPPNSPYLIVRDAARALDFYQQAFCATELYRLVNPHTGAIGHAELLINGAHLMLSEENPAWNSQSPLTLGGTSVKFCLMVADADAAVERARAAGAKVEMPASDTFYGFRCGVVSDPFGHHWMLQHRIEELSREQLQERWNTMLASGSGCGANADQDNAPNP